MLTASNFQGSSLYIKELHITHRLWFPSPSNVWILVLLRLASQKTLKLEIVVQDLFLELILIMKCEFPGNGCCWSSFTSVKPAIVNLPYFLYPWIVTHFSDHFNFNFVYHAWKWSQLMVNFFSVTINSYFVCVLIHITTPIKSLLPSLRLIYFSMIFYRIINCLTVNNNYEASVNICIMLV